MKNLFEGMEYKALEGLVKPLISVDEFTSKMGDDADIIVISFYVRDEKAAKDLMNWLESGYNEVLDADVSPGELKPNRYLVYIEIRRRTNAPKIVDLILTDLDTLTEFKADDWEMRYEDNVVPFSRENFAHYVPLSPQAYRETHEDELNEMRRAAGLDERMVYESYSDDVRSIQSIAGII